MGKDFNNLPHLSVVKVIENANIFLFIQDLFKLSKS